MWWRWLFRRPIRWGWLTEGDAPSARIWSLLGSNVAFKMDHIRASVPVIPGARRWHAVENGWVYDRTIGDPS